MLITSSSLSEGLSANGTLALIPGKRIQLPSLMSVGEDNGGNSCLAGILSRSRKASVRSGATGKAGW